MSKSLLTPILLATLLATPLAVQAGPACTTEPESKWIPEAEMTKRFESLGYKDDVKKLHVSKGKCWEIYGHDKQGRKVEVYFHPITGAIAEQNIKD